MSSLSFQPSFFKSSRTWREDGAGCVISVSTEIHGEQPDKSAICPSSSQVTSHACALLKCCDTLEVSCVWQCVSPDANPQSNMVNLIKLRTCFWAFHHHHHHPLLSLHSALQPVLPMISAVPSTATGLFIQKIKTWTIASPVAWEA